MKKIKYKVKRNQKKISKELQQKRKAEKKLTKKENKKSLGTILIIGIFCYILTLFMAWDFIQYNFSALRAILFSTLILCLVGLIPAVYVLEKKYLDATLTIYFIVTFTFSGSISNISYPIVSQAFAFKSPLLEYECNILNSDDFHFNYNCHWLSIKVPFGESVYSFPYPCELPREYYQSANFSVKEGLLGEYLVTEIRLGLDKVVE